MVFRTFQSPELLLCLRILCLQKFWIFPAWPWCHLFKDHCSFFLSFSFQVFHCFWLVGWLIRGFVWLWFSFFVARFFVFVWFFSYYQNKLFEFVLCQKFKKYKKLHFIRTLLQKLCGYLYYGYLLRIMIRGKAYKDT